MNYQEFCKAFQLEPLEENSGSRTDHELPVGDPNKKAPAVAGAF